MLLKDNIDVAGMPTTASSIVLEHSVPDKDATIVRRLKAQGAVILGKVNLTEFAAYVSNNQQNGNSSLGGQVLNPYDLAGDPGGSSSGSGVAAAAGLAALTIGSDSEGSIISPASQNGVVGIRPSDRPVEPQRRRPDLGVAGHARPARADGQRRRAAAQRRLRQGPARPAHGGHAARASTTPPA